MSINLNPDASILIGGIVKTSANNPLTLDPAQEADLINRANRRRHRDQARVPD